MSRITLDATISSMLNGLTETVELCDPSGRVLGRFLPLIDLAEWEPVTPDITEEELQEIEASDEWYTTDQVLAHLKSLENQ